jgi:signal transduction histidine kinase
MPRLGFRIFLLLVIDLLLLCACLWHPRYLMNRARVPFLLNEVQGSVVIDEVLDSSAAAGLPRGFAVLSIHGIDVRDYHDAEFLGDLRAIGDTLQVRGREGGVERTVTVRLIPFFSMRYAVISLLLGIITLATAIFVLLSRHTDRTARVLHAGLACMAFSAMTMWGSAPRGDPWLIASRVGYFVFYIGAAVNFLYFTLLFPRRAHELTRARGVLLQVPALVITALALTTHLLALQRESLESYRLFRHFFVLYHGTILVYGALGVANFIRSYRATESPEEKKKLQWLLWGLAIGPAPFLLLEILPELFIPLSPVPEEYTLVFLLIIPLSFAASFARHHLLDISLVVNRTTVYGIVVGGFVLTYLGAVAAAAAIVGQYTVGASVVSAVFVALAFEPVRRQVQHLVDRYFFRVRYDFRRAQRGFVEEMKRRPTAVDLARFVVDRVQQLIPVSRVAFVTIPAEGGSECLAEVPVRKSDHRPDFFGEVRSWVMEDEPYALPGKIEPGVLTHAVDPARLEGPGLALIVPMFSGSNVLLGFLALGGKKSGARFSSEDVDLLRSVAAQAGLEINRIMLQREVLRKEMEAQRLRDLNELKSAFVSNVSHEFHTPLTSIKLFAELLRAGVARKDAKSREFLAIIEGEADRLDQMVTTILDSTRIEKGIRLYSMQDRDLGAIVRSVLRTMRYQLRKAGFTVRTAGLTPGKRYPVRVDGPAITEVLVNLVGNAIKYSGSRKVITIGLSATGDFVKCFVRDRGEGIPQQALRHIFERYYRAPESEKKVEGIGLGLPLARNTMEAHGGRIEVESAVGKGSCFTLWIPRPAGDRGHRRRGTEPSERR